MISLLVPICFSAILLSSQCGSLPAPRTPIEKKTEDPKQAGAEYWKKKNETYQKYLETACWQSGTKPDGKPIMTCQNYQEWERQQ